MKRLIYPRKDWGAKEPESRVLFAAPARVTYIHHSVTLIDAKAKPSEEQSHMRYLQQIAFGREFSDISYSFVVFPSGNAYEGRGWKVVGAHTEGSNSVSHAICFVGNFETNTPTQSALETAGKIHKRGVKRGHVLPNAGIDGHRDAPGAQTACPGNNLYGRLGVIRKAAK